jgi:hypothetical protein
VVKWLNAIADHLTELLQDDQIAISIFVKFFVKFLALLDLIS